MNASYSRFNPYMIACGYLSLQECPRPGTFFPMRIVRWYELELMHQSNHGYVVYRDGRINAEKGVLMIRKPGTVVQGVSAYACHNVIFDSQYDPEMADYYKEPKYENPTTHFLSMMKSKRLDFLEALPDAIQVTDYPFFKHLFEQGLEAYLRNNDDQQFAGKQIIYSLLAAIIEEVKQNESRNLNKYNQVAFEAILLTKQRMDDGFNERITLQELAALAGYSNEAYCRVFKKIYGKSPIDYLIHARLYCAKKLLITTKRSIYDIALSCGFNNDTYFYTVFKKKEGLSPKKYRESNKMLQ